MSGAGSRWVRLVHYRHNFCAGADVRLIGVLHINQSRAVNKGVQPARDDVSLADWQAAALIASIELCQ